MYSDLLNDNTSFLLLYQLLDAYATDKLLTLIQLLYLLVCVIVFSTLYPYIRRVSVSVCVFVFIFPFSCVSDYRSLSLEHRSGSNFVERKYISTSQSSEKFITIDFTMKTQARKK